MLHGFWTPDSWRSKPLGQRIAYDDEGALEEVVESLRALPPLVTVKEIDALRALLAGAQDGRVFVVQAGDCAERFEDCTPDGVEKKIRAIDALVSVLAKAGLTAIPIGRIAGQYAKPRSSPHEIRGDRCFRSYFGDLYNGIDFSAEARQVDPRRLLRGYQHASMTLERMRSIARSRQTVSATGVVNKVGSGWCFTSHEGLNLYYESSLTRAAPRQGGYYNFSAHMAWIGDRTRAVSGAHVEFFRGIRNPVAVKLGPTTSPEEAVRLADVLNPGNEAGRLVFVPRFGANKVEALLPPLLRAVTAAGKRVLWICDPMHGNTRTTGSGHKTRDYETIARELEISFRVHAECGTTLGGVHLEVSGDDVVECTGGPAGVAEHEIGHRYETVCDPRLNHEQAVAIIERVATLATRAPGPQSEPLRAEVG
jgi:3-deoxy-7-phosphoheptulonate synthase